LGTRRSSTGWRVAPRDAVSLGRAATAGDEIGLEPNDKRQGVLPTLTEQLLALDDLVAECGDRR
jgi:hypothetical protein